MNYDVVAGVDSDTFHNLVKEFYKALYPAILTGQLPINALGIAAVGFDINEVPYATFGPSQTARDYFEHGVTEAKWGLTDAATPEHRSTLVELASAAAFDFAAPNIILSMTFTNGKPPRTINCSLTGTITIQTGTTSGQNFLTGEIMAATLALPSEPGIAKVLNETFVPLLISYLNSNLLNAINIPQLAYKSVQLSMPVPVVTKGYLNVYSALGSVQPDIPPPASWPAGCVLIGTDVAVLQAAVGTIFPMGPSTGFNWEIISGQVGAQVLPPNPIVINGDGSLTATIAANADCQLTLHTPNWLPNVSFGPSATASITATLLPSVSNGELQVSIEGIPTPHFSFDWGIPGWINWLFSPLEDGLSDALNAILGPLLGQVLTFPPISIMSLPTPSFHLAGKTITLTIDQATTGNVNSLLSVQAQATLS